MNINADVVLKARKQKFWSQEELAIASGLNLRTIQRIEFNTLMTKVVYTLFLNRLVS